MTPKEGDADNDESLDGMAARIEKIPVARKAIEAAGLTVRQYVVIRGGAMVTGILLASRAAKYPARTESRMRWG